MLIHYIGTNLREPRSQSGFEDDNLQTEPVSGSPTRSGVSWFYRAKIIKFLESDVCTRLTFLSGLELQTIVDECICPWRPNTDNKLFAK